MPPSPEPEIGPPPIPVKPDVEKWSWEFDGTLDDVAAARHRLSTALERHGWTQPDVASALLLLSELASNAVVHAQTPFAVTAWVDGIASVAVTDGTTDGDPEVVVRAPGEGGFGLALVSKLSARWGVHRHETGKSVWFEFDPDSSSPD